MDNEKTEKETEEEKNIEDQYEFGVTTIRDMMAEKIPLREVIEADGVRLPMKWTNLIAIINRKMTKGEKINLDTPLDVVIKIYGKLMQTSFFSS